MKTPTKRPGSPLDAIYRRVDLTPEEIFRTISRLRKDAEKQVEYLIALIDELVGDTDAELEPVESNYAGFDCLREDMDEVEGDAGCDDREAVCEDEGAEHDGREPDEEGEPSLGWTVDGSTGGCADGVDREADVSYLTEAARARFNPEARWAKIRDGMHVDSERGYAVTDRRRIHNLSDRQKALVRPRVDHDSGVGVTT